MSILDLVDLRGLLLFFLVFVPLEHLLPIHEKARGLRRGVMTDLMHFFFSGIVIRISLTAVIVVSASAGQAIVPESWGAAIRAMPLWVQVPIAIVIADLGFYLAHRIMHAVPFLWRFHAVHHSSEEMDWLAAYRVHPVDQVLVKGASLVPIFMLDFSASAIAIAAFIYNWQAIFVHSNVRIPLGPFRLVIAGPEFHHWHHANEEEAYDKNFSGQLPLWDIVFRTLNLPGRMPTRYGVDDPVPESYRGQIAYPFLRKPEAPQASINKAKEGHVGRTPSMPAE